MVTYILRRLIGIATTLLLLSLLTFVLVRVGPGGPWLQGVEIPRAPEQVAVFKATYGLDEPLWQQYLIWLRKALTLDFGVPYSAPEQTVAQLIARTLPYSALVGGLAACLALLLGTALGVLAAARPHSWLDHSITVWASVVGAVPGFVLAYVLIYLFAVQLRWLPAGGWGGPRHLVLPVIAFGLPAAGMVVRWTRTCMAETLTADFVRAARARGLRERTVLMRHALRNALIPLLTALLPLIPVMMTGSIFIEQVFGLPGLGRYFVLASTNRDYPLVLGMTVFWALLIALTYLLTDILAVLCDPRVRLGARAHDA